MSRADLAGLALAADRSWYQPLFWFCLCGPLGAFAYRLSANLAAEAAGEASITSALTQAREIMEALPARLTVVAFGIAGSLVPVLVTVREIGVLRWGASSELLARAALAAIDNGRADQVSAGDTRVYHLNLMHSLVRRTLVVWLVFLAIGALLVF